MQVQWEGVMPAMTTAFTSDDKLDLELLNRNISAQLEAGVSGIILAGTLGEASTLTEQEKDLLITNSVGVVAGSVPVICNIAEQSTRAAIVAAQRAERSGAQGLMLLPPMRYKATNQEVVTYFKEVAAATQLPIMIYNNPVDYGIAVTLEMFDELLESTNIQAVKESTREISNITKIQSRFGNRLKILCGVDTLALESIVMGAHGWVAGLVCAFPAETVAIYKLARAGKIREAKAIYQWFMPLLELDLSPQLVQNIKLAAVATGLGSENVRLPRLPLQGAARKRVMEIIDAALASRPVLPEYKELQATPGD